jgi:16S rRNA (guanine(966)-N(2))-methyltransferase RsmD
MRVIAGSLKGRRLEAPAWDGLRPTSDKLRETLFNVLAPRIAGARVADVYAGTGAVGIEAISRGADLVLFVDRDRRALQLIAANLARCGVTSRYTIVRSPARRALALLDPDARFDVVFLDPPYAVGHRELLDVLTQAGDRLASGGVAVLEHASRREVPEHAGRLARSREIASGDSTLTFYEVAAPDGGSPFGSRR